MLELSAAAEAAMRRHAEDGYPLEVCGFLVGTAAGDDRRAAEAWPVPNAWESDPGLRADLLAGLANPASGWDGVGEERRFLVSPRDTMAAMKRAREAGLDLIGVYHTHPNHPAQPSAFDRDAAWPEWSYLILSVRDARVTEIRSWVVADDTAPFAEEAVVVAE
jgi:proteasome lid subunit RPN8/RPN11